MKLQRTVFLSFLVFLSLAIASQNALAKPVGKAKMVLGKVLLQSANGQQKRFRRGNPVNIGDIIITNKRSQAQLVMIDGSNISVRPDTQFQVEEFVATGDVDKDKTNYSLLKGGFRSVTGSIGKKNKASFQLKTPVATMGIRGTDFTSKYCDGECLKLPGAKKGLFVDVISGGVSLSNEGGTYNLTPKTNGYVADRKKKPGKIGKLPDNLLSPRAKKGERKRYPSPEQELVQISTFVAPELKEEIIEEATAAGVPTKLIIQGASSGGLRNEEIVPSILESGKRHGKSPNDLIRSILESGVGSEEIVEQLMAQNPSAATGILTSAIASGKVNINRLRRHANRMGISDEDVRGAEALGNMLSVPDELKDILEDAQGSQDTGSENSGGGLNSRELVPKSNTQTVASPS